MFAAFSLLFRSHLLRFLGGSEENIGYAETYLIWVVVLGGVPTVLSMIQAHFLRSEGHAKLASAGMMTGGILNIILDPLFIYGLHMGFMGAAVATALSNLISMLFFLACYCRMKERTVVSLSPHHFSMRFAGQVFSVGIASALTRRDLPICLI